MLHTIMEAAEKLKVSRATVYQMAREGQLKTVRVRRSLRVAELDKFIQKGGC